MSGNYKEGQSKDLSGVYSLIVASVERAALGLRGILAVVFTSNWGPVNQLVELETKSDLDATFNAQGTALTAKKVSDLAYADDAYRPAKLQAYRAATAAAVKGTVTLECGLVDWVLETLYPSNRAFTAVVSAGVAGGSKALAIVEAGVELMKIEAVTVDEFEAQVNASAYIRVQVKGDALPADTAAANFAGGSNGDVITVTEYNAFITEVEVEKTANTLVLDGVTDEAIITAAVTWLKRVRDEGFRLDFFRGGVTGWDADLTLGNAVSTAANYRGIHNVNNGADGYTSADMAIYLAAVWAGCPLNRSLADHVTPFKAVNVKTPLTVTNRVTAKKAGSLLFHMQGGKVVIDEGVNTLTAPTGDEVTEYGKMRVSRTIDVIANDTEAFGEAFKKNLSNTAEARRAYAAAVEDTYFTGMVTLEAIRADYSYEEDADHHGKTAPFPARIDEAFFVSSFYPVDSMEKVYQKFTARFGG